MNIEKLQQIKHIIQTRIFLSASHGGDWQESEEWTEEILQNNQSKFINLDFYERHALIKKLLKIEGLMYD